MENNINLEKKTNEDVVEINLENLTVLEEALTPQWGWWCGCAPGNSGFMCG